MQAHIPRHQGIYNELCDDLSDCIVIIDIHVYLPQESGICEGRNWFFSVTTLHTPPWIPLAHIQCLAHHGWLSTLSDTVMTRIVTITAFVFTVIIWRNNYQLTGKLQILMPVTSSLEKIPKGKGIQLVNEILFDLTQKYSCLY